MSQALIQSKTVITQNTGTSKTMVMSQDAVTNSLSNIDIPIKMKVIR